MSYDLVSLGEVMLRMSPPRYERLRRARQLDVHVVGSQLNVAANLARLGKSTAFLSKLPDNELGLLARDQCESYGVDMSHVLMEPGTRMGVFYLEHTATPRVSAMVYDRARSAASTITAEDFDFGNTLKGTAMAYTDGIMPGLGTGCREAASIFLITAKSLDCVTAFDMNYREHLWTAKKAYAAWTEMLPYVDVIVTNRSVSEAVFEFKGTDEEIMRQYADEFGTRTVVLTSREVHGVLHGAWTSQALHDGELAQGRRFEFDVIDRFGSGDAFMAGLLYGYMERNADDPEYALDFGNALCALAHTIEGDIAEVSPAEVEAILSDDYNLSPKR